MGSFVIASYRPKKGKEAELLEVLKEHVPILRKLGLATDKTVHIMKAKDGAIVEVFEWESEDAISRAHSHPVVLEMWKRFEACCDYIPLAEIEETRDMFAGFKPVNV
jgi:quinol monooxygenase YgiN